MKKHLPKMDENGLYSDYDDYEYDSNPLVEYFDPSGSIVTTIGGS